MAKREPEVEKENGERWLLTYADMITLLLALFVVLYAISSVDAAKYEAISQAMTGAFEGTGSGSGSGSGQGADNLGFPDNTQQNPDDLAIVQSHFSDLYEKLQNEIDLRGYTDTISVVQSGESIIVRFKDSVLFYPDKAEIIPAGYEALSNISTTISEMGDEVGHIQIEGHTAFIGEEYDRTFEAWNLSANRAIAVLRYLNLNGNIDQSKMNLAGYSHFVPIADNDTEEGRSQNRRVELRISPPSPSGGANPNE